MGVGRAGTASEVGLKVRCSPDCKEETVFFYDCVAKKLKMDMSRSTMRDDDEGFNGAESKKSDRGELR